MKRAFTLAEVLITLAVIGIVATLTIGVFLPKIHSTIRSHQIAVAETKFTKAMEQMALNNEIGAYYEDTKDFVNHLQRYLKLAKTCDNEHLEDCFGYDEIEMKDGNTYALSDIKTGKVFGMPDDDTNDYKGSTYGIQTIDGVSMVLSWNTKCPTLEPGVYQWGGNTNESTGCVAAIMDINGKTKRNVYEKDVVLFRARELGSACGIEFTYDGVKYCWTAPIETMPLSVNDCQNNKARLKISRCLTYGEDYWGGALNICGSKDKMVSREDLASLASYLYETPISSGAGINSSLNRAKLNDLSSLSKIYNTHNMQGFSIWTNEENIDSGRIRNYTYDRTALGDCMRIASHPYAICKIK